jgi:hypothetical protein
MTVNAIKTNDRGNNERALPKYIQLRWPVCTVIAKPGRIFKRLRANSREIFYLIMRCGA